MVLFDRKRYVSLKPVADLAIEKHHGSIFFIGFVWGYGVNAVEDWGSQSGEWNGATPGFPKPRPRVLRQF